MITYEFYTDTFGGRSIPEEEFKYFINSAVAKLNKYKETYSISFNGVSLLPYSQSLIEQEKMAVCALADAMHFYNTVANGGVVLSSTIGTVSTSYKTGNIDMSGKFQEKEYINCVKMYLVFYRGANKC